MIPAEETREVECTKCGNHFTQHPGLLGHGTVGSVYIRVAPFCCGSEMRIVSRPSDDDDD